MRPSRAQIRSKKMAPDSDDRSSDLDPDLAAKLFGTMAVSRTLESQLIDYVRDNGIAGFYHPGWGQEAAPAGATAALRRDDYLFYQGRGVAWVVGKGMDPGPILGDLLGKVTGSTGGKGAGVPHWADPMLGIMGEGATLGSVYPLAAGAALATKLRGGDQVALADFGDGTSARGTFHETLIQAVVWKLPLVYFCENNGYAVTTPFSSVSPTENVADRAAAYGIPGVVVDGQDAFAVYEATTEAVARARAGEGPSLIEAKVTRVRGHWEGDAQKYRDKSEFENYRDPLDVLRTRLDPEVAAQIETDAETAVSAAFREAIDAPYPDASIITKDVFA